MSDDLISRQAAIDFIKEHSYPVRYDNTSIEQGMTITGIEEALNEIPNIQSKQKTGHCQAIIQTEYDSKLYGLAYMGLLQKIKELRENPDEREKIIKSILP